MIGWLRGRMIGAVSPGEVLIDVGGVGYRLSVPASTMAGLTRSEAQEVELHVHTHVRDDAIVLFGFTTAEELRYFELLISAHGVGPMLALAVLSTLPAGSLERAVVGSDVDALCQVPGVGRKTAQRLILELRSKFEALGPDLPAGGVLGSADPVAGALRASGDGVQGELRAALAELGYGSDEVRHALDSVGTDGSVEELLRLALRELAVPSARVSR